MPIFPLHTSLSHHDDMIPCGPSCTHHMQNRLLHIGYIVPMMLSYGQPHYSMIMTQHCHMQYLNSCMDFVKSCMAIYLTLLVPHDVE